tara:strand:- start:611 stop:1432 length:822 start_codon:yes stop_codon:yes gene_type:complete
MYKVGIAGRGFVGSAIERFISEFEFCEVKSYDIKDDEDIESGYKNIVEDSDFIYICLPTPRGEDGRCFTDIVRDSCSLIYRLSNELGTNPIVLIKSTLSVGTIRDIQDKNPNMLICSNPEFLTERRAYKDFKSADKHLIGLGQNMEEKHKQLLVKYHSDIWPDAECVFTGATQAELIKQTTNSFFAVKIIFANQLYDLCQEIGIDYSNFISAGIKADPRLGDMHWEVPGHDGKRGFGGHCLPKDLMGLIKIFEDNNVSQDILAAANKYNKERR